MRPKYSEMSAKDRELYFFEYNRAFVRIAARKAGAAAYFKLKHYPNGGIVRRFT